ncbi:Transposase IS4 [Popillia japonica]|uniref:Transposase IS4 n=1 Tax=Popillia japonica TaxID=7064 RepID=A0AAW1N370_POPJA
MEQEQSVTIVYPKAALYLPKIRYTKSQKRGDFISAIDKEDGIIVTKWLDNNVLSVASTCHGVNPTAQVKRFSQKEKRIIQVSRPSVITEYNRFMGGTDLMDENISRYRISFRRKKWRWPLFTWLLDTSVVNAWSVRRKCKSKPPISQLQYRRHIVLDYLQKYKTASKGPGRPSTSKNSVTLNRVSDDI